MAWAKPTTITSWSYSRYNTYKQCPLKAKLTIIDKLQEPKNAAMERGTAIHNMAEGFLKGTVKTLPKELKAFGPMFKDLKASIKKPDQVVIVEDMWGYTAKWAETAWNNWSDCKVRVKLDVAHINGDAMTIIDWKTGKYRPDNLDDYVEQQELYAVAGLSKYASQVKTVTPQLVYLDAGVLHPSLTYAAKDLPGLKKLWEKRTKPMLNDKTFAPRPNKYCGWCHFRKGNNGPCPY